MKSYVILIFLNWTRVDIIRIRLKLFFKILTRFRKLGDIVWGTDKITWTNKTTRPSTIFFLEKKTDPSYWEGYTLDNF